MRILFFDIDTLRADHLGCYGYHRNTSPNIDRIASKGVRFDNYYCSDAPCLPSRTALMSGRFGIHTGVVNHFGLRADMRHEGAKRLTQTNLGAFCLPRCLKEKGLKTVSISPFAERHSAWHFYAGFNEMYNPGNYGMESAEEITPIAKDWIKRNAKKDNWFLHINYWDPHTPYRAPKDFGNPFKDEPLPNWLTEEVVKKHQQCVGPHCAREINMYDNSENPIYPRQPGEITDMESLRRMIDGYDCGIKYVDDHIGQILSELGKQGILEDTALIITADHGENMGELGIYGEHATADNPTCRIPMIIKWPGGKEGHVDKDLHYNLDLLPTLNTLLNVDLSHYPKVFQPIWDGQSFDKVITEGKSCGRDYLVLSQCAHVCQRSVRFNNWLYIRTYHDGFHLFDKEMLFDIENDPHQQENLAAERKDICQAAVSKYLDWHDEMMLTMDDDIDPMWTVIREGGPGHARGCLKKYCEHLQKTNRGWAIEELKKKHPTEF